VRERCGLGGGRQEQGHLLDRLVGGPQACRGQLLALAGGQQGDSRGHWDSSWPWQHSMALVGLDPGCWTALDCTTLQGTAGHYSY
jgi:hypothetical protein